MAKKPKEPAPSDGGHEADEAYVHQAIRSLGWTAPECEDDVQRAEAELLSAGIIFSEEYKAADLARRFRDLTPPVIGRVEGDRFILDLKAVDVDEMDLLTQAIETILS